MKNASLLVEDLTRLNSTLVLQGFNADDFQKYRTSTQYQPILAANHTYRLTWSAAGGPTPHYVDLSLFNFPQYDNTNNNTHHHLFFQPIAVEKNLGACSSSSSDFISALGHKISSVSGEWKRNIILVPASVCGIATIQCSFSARHLRSPERSGPIATLALLLLHLTLGNYTLKGI